MNTETQVPVSCTSQAEILRLCAFLVIYFMPDNLLSHFYVCLFQNEMIPLKFVC